MSLLAGLRGSDCAVQTSSALLAGLTADGDGAPVEIRLPDAAVRPRLQGDNLDAAAFADAVLSLAGSLPGRARRVTLVLPDSCAKVRIVPIETESVPRGRAATEMAHWALRDTLPFPVDEARVETELFERGESRHLLVAAAHRGVLEEYEAALEPLGPVVRSLPATLACGWAVDEVIDEAAANARTPEVAAAANLLLVHADADAMGCMVSRSGAPLFVRSRAIGDEPHAMRAAMAETLAYLRDRLQLVAGIAALSGRAAGDTDLQEELAAHAWNVQGRSSATDPRFDALIGALRVAEAGS